MSDTRSEAKGGRYHHGDLKAALVDAAIGLIAERGVRDFSLAEVSRRLDVLNHVLANQTKFIVPAGSDLVNVLGLDDKAVVPLPRESGPAR